MINEGIFRSPKWMRNFVDFEINTGKDIKGQPSKKELKKIKLKEWDDRWNSENKVDILQFMIDNKLGNDFNEVQKVFKGDDRFWSLYDKWLKEKKIKSDEYDRIKKKIVDLYDQIYFDWRSNPYVDKVKTIKIEGKIKWIYKLENGTIISLLDNKLETPDSTFSLDSFFKNMFIDLANKITDNSKQRTKPNDNNYHNSSYNKKNQENDPIRSKWNKLKDIVKLREDQLRNMPNSDPNKKLLQNELDSYKRKIDQMKSQYKFEKLNSFSKFRLV